jgi:ParB family transcriptional regulator, chromosome partitioning protein
VTKERRLGRGLEALLGRIPARTETAGDATPTKPAESGRSAPPEAQVDAASNDSQQAPVSDENARRDVPIRTRAAKSADARATESAGAPTAEPQAGQAGPLRLPVRQIESSPYQPRQEFDEDELQALCDSLRAHGLLQPIVVRRVADRYQLVAGERRLRAAAKAGWTDVPVHVIEADDRQASELAIVENLQRKDLNPLEKAASFQRYLEQYGCTQEDLAARLKLDRSTIANLIRLLELPPTVQDAVRQGKITQGHARALLPLGDEQDQVTFCQRIQSDGLSVRDTEALVQQSIDQADTEPLSVIALDGTKTRPRRATSEHVAALEQEFRAALGARVKLSHNARGRGKLVIHFESHDEFDRIHEQICNPEGSEEQTRAG